MILSTASLSAVTAKPSIVEDIDFLVGTNSTTYPLADKLRNANNHYDVAVTDIISSNSNWEWDDTNYTNFPIGTTTLVASQADYSLSGVTGGLLKILRVEVLDAQGHYHKLQQFDESQAPGTALTELTSTNGLPTFYREVGLSLELYPKPAAGSVTLAAGLKVYYQRNKLDLTTSDASVAPGIALPFHRILSYGPALDYMLARKPKEVEKIRQLRLAYDTMRQSMMDYYASRNREVIPKIKARRYSYN